MWHIRGLLLTLPVLVYAMPTACAGNFTNIVAFGDSLTDVGNLYAAYAYPPDPPYWNGRFSNGPVWVEYLAQNYGLAAPTPSSSGGSDYAWGGAVTGTATLPPGVLTQVGQYLSNVGNTADSNALYIVWAGANDAFNDPANFDPVASAQNVATAVQTLYGAAARTFLVPNMPPLEKTPYALANAGDAALLASDGGRRSTPTSSADVTSLQASDSGIGFMDMNLKNVDPNVGDVDGVYNCVNYLIAHPVNPPYWDFQDFTDEGSQAGPPADGSTYLFWDDVHPTTVADQLLADTVPVPEPGTLILLSAAWLFGLPLGWRRLIDLCIENEASSCVAGA